MLTLSDLLSDYLSFILLRKKNRPKQKVLIAENNSDWMKPNLVINSISPIAPIFGQKL